MTSPTAGRAGTTAEHRDRVGRGGRRPGRPRAAGHDARILDAATLLIERGEDVTVNRVVELGRVSRAAIYRRWPSMTDLVAAALDHGREPYEIPLDGDLLENLLAAFTPAAQAAGKSYPEERFRLRVRLAMTDRKLAQAYWRSHVARRRGALVAVLRAGVERGELRHDLDVDACIDLVNGVFYYQYVVRGVRLDDPAAVARCREAVRVAWRGMSVGPRRSDADADLCRFVRGCDDGGPTAGAQAPDGPDRPGMADDLPDRTSATSTGSTASSENGWPTAS